VSRASSRLWGAAARRALSSVALRSRSGSIAGPPLLFVTPRPSLGPGALQPPPGALAAGGGGELMLLKVLGDVMDRCAAAGVRTAPNCLMRNDKRRSDIMQPKIVACAAAP
jgi:hypothetical protein